MNKPKYLYHASNKRSIKVFEPRAETIRGLNEGNVVFATLSKVYASIFIVPSNDTWTRSGKFGGVYFKVVNSRKRYERLDKGGAIYKFLSKSFEYNPDIGMGYMEWTSKKPVKPIDKEIYDSGLEAMIGLEVQVYFVDDKQFKKIINSKDHGNAILRKLRSENQRRGVNVKEIPKYQI